MKMHRSMYIALNLHMNPNKKNNHMSNGHTPLPNRLIFSKHWMMGCDSNHRRTISNLSQFLHHNFCMKCDKGNIEHFSSRIRCNQCRHTNLYNEDREIGNSGNEYYYRNSTQDIHLSMHCRHYHLEVRRTHFGIPSIPLSFHNLDNRKNIIHSSWNQLQNNNQDKLYSMFHQVCMFRYRMSDIHWSYFQNSLSNDRNTIGM